MSPWVDTTVCTDEAKLRRVIFLSNHYTTNGNFDQV